MEKTDAGLQMPLYLRNITIIQLYTTQNNSLVATIPDAMHGELICSHRILPWLRCFIL